MIVYLSSREVLSGVTDRLATWKARGWKTAKGKQVAHHDEWRKVNEWHTALSRYCPITYEWIHRDQNEACEICKDKRDWIQMEHACQWALDNDPELRKEMETEARKKGGLGKKEKVSFRIDPKLTELKVPANMAAIE